MLVVVKVPKVRSWLLLVALVIWSAGCVQTATTTTAGGPTTTTIPHSTLGTTAPITTLVGRPVVPIGIESLPDGLRRQIIDLVAVTEDVRGLRFLQAPNVVVVDKAELAERVQGLIDEDAADAEIDGLIYGLLGLIGKDVDFVGLLGDLYGEQVAGYYNGEAGELVFSKKTEELSPLEASVLVHELTHELTDQHFKFFDQFNALIDADRFDEASAWQALIEGDAVFAEVLHLQTLSRREQLALFEESEAISTDVRDNSPDFLLDQFVYPYESGARMVAGLYQQGGGYDAVNAAYASPPQSTEQVLHSNTDPPVLVDVPEVQLAGYDLVRTSAWGELTFQAVLDQEIGQSAREAIVGWGGDGYRVYRQGDDAVFFLIYQGDSTDDAREMATALRQIAADSVDTAQRNDNTYTGDDFAYVARTGDSVTFIAATDPSAGADVVAQLG